MNETKSALSSTTIKSSIVGGILGLITLLKAFGVDIDLDQGNVTEIVGAFAIIITAAMAAWGRFKATSKIK